MGDPVKHLALLRAIREYSMPPHEKAFMLSLCLFGDEDGTNIRPSQQTIATQHQISWRRAAKIYQTLKEKGYISEDGWHKRCKKWRINTELFLAELPKKEVKAKKEKPAAPAPPKPVVPPVDDRAAFIAKRVAYYIAHHLSEGAAKSKAEIDFEQRKELITK